MRVGAYAKAIVAAIGAVATIAAKVLVDDAISTAEFVEIGIALIAAVGVWRVANSPQPARADKIIPSREGA